MPIAIAGMHRAGTSMIARMLSACGLGMGPAEQHLPPQPDNPEGFYEHRAFVDLNERLLAALGGIWRDPPKTTPGWENDASLDMLLEEARSLPVQFGFREPWGWKDPRNSLTIPFWRRVFPDLTVVICVRHPLETAYSLLERDHLPIRMGLGLWRAYYGQALHDAPAQCRCVVHYAAYFQQAEVELRRILGALSLPADNSAISAACNLVSGRLRHSRLGVLAMDALHANKELFELYDGLLQESGFAPTDNEESLSGATALDDAVIRLERSLDACVRKYWRQLDRERELDERESKVDQMEKMIAGQRAYIEEREKHLGDMERHLAILGARLADLEERLSARRHRYADAVANAAWRVMRPFRR